MRDTQGNSSLLVREIANELLYMACRELTRYPTLRLGQAILAVDATGILKSPWPELFYEEDPAKATEIFFKQVENSGKRNLTGSINTSFMQKED